MSAFESLEAKRAELAARIEKRRERIRALEAERDARRRVLDEAIVAGKDNELPTLKKNIAALELEAADLAAEAESLERSGPAALADLASAAMDEVRAGFEDAQARQLKAIEEARAAYRASLSHLDRITAIDSEAEAIGRQQSIARETNRNIKQAYGYRPCNFDKLELELKKEKN